MANAKLTVEQMQEAVDLYAQFGKVADAAKFLGIPKSDMSRIFNHRIDRFSTDKLVRLFAKIKPNFQLKVA